MRLNYLAKVLLSLLGLVLLVELASYATTRLVVRDAVADNARQELERGGEVFAQLMRARAEQLSLSVQVLTDDFGFKEAVALADAPTLQSALENHAARIGADIALVANEQGELVAGTQSLPEDSWQYLAPRTTGTAGDSAHSSLMVGGRPYQFVVSEVRAPVRVGTAGLGFEIDNELTRQLKRLTGLDISFISMEPGDLKYLSGTVDQSARHALLEWLDATRPEPEQVIASDELMSLMLSVAEEPSALVVVLQVPMEQVMAPFARLNSQLLWVALGFSLVAAVLAVFLARSVTQPISELAHVARRMAGGYYDTPIHVSSRDELGELAEGFTKMQVAIAEREQQVLHQARHDSLTGLMNRTQLFPDMESAIEGGRWSEKGFALLVIDIDNFTRINDALSPEIGDQVLAEVAARLASNAGQNDIVARLGSDEFALVLAGATAETAEAQARHLLDCFSEDIQLGDLNLGVGLNIGLVTYPEGGSDPETLLRRANLALSHARLKQQRIMAYQAGWDELHLRRLMLFGEFKKALAHNEISLNYQPKLSLSPNPGKTDGNPVRDPIQLGVEALVRWQHPELGFVNPEEFVAVAESTGQIGLLTRWVLREAISRVAVWPGQVHLSVNLSALDLLDDELPGYIDQLLNEQQLAPERLCLEITESAIMREADKSLHNLERLRALGMSLSIDDFGTGYSSLSQLKKLPVAELKIDKSFILNLDKSEDDQLIVRSTIDLGHTMGLQITAEGVESEAIEALLRTYGCDRVQGFYYSRPVPEAEFLKWLNAYQVGL